MELLNMMLEGSMRGQTQKNALGLQLPVPKVGGQAKKSCV